MERGAIPPPDRHAARVTGWLLRSQVTWTPFTHLWNSPARDRKSTRLTPVTNAHLVCRLLLEKKKTKKQICTQQNSITLDTIPHKHNYTTDAVKIDTQNN